ncbi:MAG: Flp pilus assembly complex ATPase component TadA [Proteobacteria bacterium]|nr:Flp pilus assembly complex ATPase component TadA [Pseudomonadota bacterium]
MKQSNQEQQALEQYASLSQRKILSSEADLGPKDQAMPEMLTWCREQKNIVVLQSCTILTSEPTSRLVQNCKIVMHNKGLVPGLVFPATGALIKVILENAEEKRQLETNVDGVQEVSTQQQRLRLLVKGALDMEATDIHMEVRAEIARIRFRKHGELFLHAEWAPKLAREVASVAFNKETDHNITHFNPLVPQNASMPLMIDDREVRLRLASLPAHGGFDVVMRILTTADRQVPTLEKLGYGPEQVTMLKRALHMPYGAVILAGPTGSGKTTTLAACMQLVEEFRKLYSIEDPVEKVVASVTQVPVNTEHYDRSFASMARTILRMDPDVLVLGEMRDEDTAGVMVRAAITGHLVFSTVHANSAPGIVTRLADLGVSTELLASPDLLICLICQRLAPLLCRYCMMPLEKSEKHLPHFNRWREPFGEFWNNVRVRGKECAKCHGLGISARTVVAEMIWLDEQSRQYVHENNIVKWKSYLKENGWLSYHDQLLSMVRQGLVDPIDAESLAGEFNIQGR